MTKSSGADGEISQELHPVLCFGDPTFSNTSSASLRFRFRGLRFTRIHFSTWSSKTTEQFKHDDGSWGPSLCARKKRSTASRLCLPGFTWGSHRHLPGPPGGLSAGGPGDARACGVQRAEAVTFARAAPSGHGPGRPPPSRCAPEPPKGAILPTAVARRRRGESAVGMLRRTHCPREGSAGSAPPALTSALTCRASPHSAPAWRSLCSGCGGRGKSQVYPGSRPNLPPPRPTNSARRPTTSPAEGEGGSEGPAARAQRPPPGRPAGEQRARGARNT